jgi:hypothetical protein
VAEQEEEKQDASVPAPPTAARPAPDELTDEELDKILADIGGKASLADSGTDPVTPPPTTPPQP